MRLHSSGVGSDAAGRSWRRSMGRVSRVLCVGVILVVLTTVVQCVGAESLKRTFLQPAPDLIKENFPLSNLTRHVVDRLQLADRKYETTKDDVVRVRLMHRDHADSPFSSSSSKSFQTRFAEALQRSYSRAAYLGEKMRTPASASAQNKFESAVSAGTGEYLMSLSLGTPPQQFAAIVDTGSDLNWVQCLPCKICYQQTTSKFDPSKSSTFHAVPCTNPLCQALPVQGCADAACQYDYVYGDQSSTLGELAFDTISLKNGGIPEGIPDFAFGCGHSNQGTFAGAGGLVGLGQGPVSLISQLSSTFPNRFSYCLVNLNAAATTTSALLFGNVDVVAGVQYTPIVSNPLHPTYYYVQMVGISVGGNNLDIAASTFDIDSSGAGGTILDSGTTITMLTLPAYEAVLTAFKAQITYPLVDGTPYGLDLCFDIAGVTNPTVPEMSFQFQGSANFQLLPENLFAIVDTANTVLCLAMAGSEGFSIIGNIQQQDHLVIYDRVAQRIGFAVTTC
ncbi:hypothetical protein BDL97_05G126800 [Sphagnum fallax]|nr:hypothetical protein BDL97_05G126800 [Sphagnum fallax]